VLRTRTHTDVLEDLIMSVNWLAVIVAAISTMALGGIWYSGLFMRAWAQASGVKAPAASPPTYGVMFVLALLAAWAFATLLGPGATAASGLALGLKVGALFVAASLWVNYAFANRGTTLWLIDAGFHLVRFALFGLILGLWR
jgi:hypothetical protein